MKNKRFLAVLLIFVFVCGVAVSSALIFRVQVVEVQFRSGDMGAEYIKDTLAIETLARDVASEIAMGKNIVFSVDRKKIIEAIETAEKRIRVTNDVVAQFPNKLHIVIRERYAMYEINLPSGDTAILDARLRIVADEWTLPRNLVDISGTFDIVGADEAAFAFEVGKDLYDYLDLEDEETANYAQSLVSMFEVLESEDFYEDQISHMVETIEFPDAADKMIMNFRADYLGASEADGVSSTIEIRGYTENFHQKLSDAFWVYQEQGNVPADVVVDTEPFEGEFGNLPVELGNGHFVLWVPKE